MALEKICPTCGFGNPPPSPFCAKCGVSLVAVPLSDGFVVEPTGRSNEEGAAAKRVCPECKAQNEVGSTRCIYCDCVLLEDCRPCDAWCVELVWPWGREELGDVLRIGRDPPAPAALISAIDTHGFDNISRSHAEIRRGDGGSVVMVTDLGSTNGTFVDGVKIPANTPTRVVNGAVVRFAANLSFTVSIKSK